MRKKIAIFLTLTLFVTLGAGTTYAIDNDSTEATVETVSAEQPIDKADEEEIENSAGILPDSVFYALERKIEELQLAITQTEEKLASLMSQFAAERAAEAVIMTSEGEEELAGEAASEYIEMLSSATAHINNAIKQKDEAVEAIAQLNEVYKKSQEILKTIVDKVPEEAKGAIEDALNNQDEEIAAVNGFYAAKEAFFTVKEGLEKAKQDLAAAKKAGDAEAITAAEQKVIEAEALKDELEELKDAADCSKEEVKHLIEKAENRLEIGFKQIEKANEKIDKTEEKVSEEAQRLEVKTREAMERAKEKAREEAKRAEEQERD